VTRIGLVLVAALAGACVSEYQTAHTVPVGKVSVTGAMTHIRSTSDFTGGSADSVDLIARAGVAPQVEVSGRYDNYGTISTVLAGGKYAVVPERFAVAASLGPFWGQGDYGGIFFVPALIGSAPLAPNVELTATGKLFWLFPDEGSSESEIGFDVGLRLSTDLDAWAFQPSIGWLHIDNAGDNSNFLSFGAALSITR